MKTVILILIIALLFVLAGELKQPEQPGRTMPPYWQMGVVKVGIMQAAGLLAHSAMENIEKLETTLIR